MVYIVITGFLFLLRYILRNKRDGRNQIYYVVLLGLFLFSTYRYQVGCDWYGYYKLFLKMPNWDTIKALTSRDPISHLIIYYVSKAGLPYPYIYIPFGLVFFIGIHILARRQPDPLGFLILLFPILITNMTMSGVRQAAAIGIVCIALVAFIDKRPLRFIFFIFLAAAFHSSAIIFLILLPFTSGHYDNIRFTIAAITTLFGSIVLAYTNNFQYVVNAYIDTGREAYGSIFRIGLLVISSIYFYLFAKNKWKNTFPNDYGLVNLCAVGIFITLFLVPISTIISDRFAYYFIPIQAMIFARLPYLPFKRNHSIYVALPYLGIAIFFIVWTQISWHFHECYIPYKSWILGLPGGNILK